MKNIENLKNSILNLPNLGTTGMILFIVSMMIILGVSWWYKRNAKRITHEQNEKQRIKDQAENKIINQEITDEWDQTHDTIEALRKNGDGRKKPRPKPGDV